MPSLLHLDSSANCSRESVSRQLTALFAGIWQDRHGPAGYRYRDLAADPVPPLDNAFCALGRRAERLGLVRPAEVAGLAGTPAEKHQWALTSPLISELLAAGTVLIGAPMYNYSVPASLKAWIDRVSFPGAFTDPETGCSRLRGTRIVVITARGGTYRHGSPRQALDLEIPYLRAYFRRHGVAVENIRFISAELTLAGLIPRLARFGPVAASSLAAAQAQVIGLAGADSP